MPGCFRVDRRFDVALMMRLLATPSHKQNAIREKNQALNYLRLSSRIDAVAARLESAIRMKQVSGTHEAGTGKRR